MNLRRSILYLILAIFLALRLYGLGSDILNSDGARWHRRSEVFLSSVLSGDFASTYRQYHPGVTLMWLNAITKEVTWKTQDFLKIPRWSLENSQDFLKIHAISKSVLVLILAILVIYQMLIISKITSIKVALLYGFFISTEPYLIGIDRWFHLTSLESYCAFSAYLTYLYANVTRDKRQFVVSGILIGLSALSKITGSVVLVLITITESVKALYSGRVKFSLVSLVIIIASFSITTFLLFPALWVDFSNVMLQLIGAAVSAVDGETPVQDFKTPFSYTYYLVILGYKLSPVTLAAFAISLAAFARQLRLRKTEQEGYILAYLFTFGIILTLSSKKIDRYSLALIPPLILFMSMYLSKIKVNILALVVTAQLLVLGHFYVAHFPALSGYYSPVFGGTRAALNVHVYDNSGEYFAQAALYLNNKSRSDVYVPNNLEAFRYFYEGNSMPAFAPSAGYVVTSVDFDRKSSLAINECSTLEKSFGPKNSIPVVSIYRCPVFPLTR